jgi:hypothetical protein
MNGQQHAVMWMGILLIILRLFTTIQWDELKAVFGWTDASTKGGKTGGGSVLPDPLSAGASVFSKVFGFVERDVIGKGIT